jgi:hypothetical protein
MSKRYFHDEFACNLIPPDNTTWIANQTMVENCSYRDNLKEAEQLEGNFKDAEQLYMKGWMQTTNIICGCVVLAILIYSHK